MLEGQEGPAAKRVIFSGRRGMGIIVTDYAVQLLMASHYTAMPDGLFSNLVYYELIVPEDEDELQEIVTINLLGVEDGAGREHPAMAPGNELPVPPVLRYRTAAGCEYYDDRMAAALLNNACSCAQCRYLPLCGGKIDKHTGDNLDCPPFTEHFTEKVLLKYGINSKAVTYGSNGPIRAEKDPLE